MGTRGSQVWSQEFHEWNLKVFSEKELLKGNHSYTASPERFVSRYRAIDMIEEKTIRLEQVE